MSLILLVRREAEVENALREARELLVLQRSFGTKFDEPEDLDLAVGVWVHPDLDEALPSWSLGHEELVARESAASEGRRPRRRRGAARIALRASARVGSRWALCWLDDAALLGGRGGTDRLLVIEALLDALATYEPDDESSRFFPIFGPEDDDATITDFMSELSEAHGPRLGSVYFLERRLLVQQGEDRSAA